MEFKDRLTMLALTAENPDRPMVIQYRLYQNVMENWSAVLSSQTCHARCLADDDTRYLLVRGWVDREATSMRLANCCSVCGGAFR